jgi:hypothetical protein
MKALCLAIAVAALLVGQPTGERLTGSWTATFEERTFVRLEIKTVDGRMAGGLSVGDFQLDSQGAVKHADAAPLRLMPIFDISMNGSSVTFFTRDASDTTKFELRLLDGAGADLHFLLDDDDRRELAANGVPTPKPIHLTKAG